MPGVDALRPLARTTQTTAAPPPRERPAEPRDSMGPAVLQGPPTFPEVRGEVQLRARNLAAEVRRALPEVDLRTAAALGKVENLAASLTEGSSMQVKLKLREATWELRQALEAGPPEGQAPPIRKALEKLRNASLDNSWERGLSGFPMVCHMVRPPVSSIPNYDHIGRGVFRGGQPDADGVDWLVAHGVATEVDLRGDDRDNQWIAPPWGNVRRHHIPVADYGIPTLEQVEEFGRVLEEAQGPVFVHCKAGVGRTGTMVACWRITMGWTADEAIARERFYAYDGSFRQEQFVREFEALWKSRGQKP